MAIHLKNLDGSLQARINGNYPDIGQVFYLVDANYRTSAQGWSRSDGTGPLDLWAERNDGYVFRTTDSSYANDAACIQDAINAMVDYRGDTLLFTPGNYSVGTILAMNVANARYLGPPVAHARRAAAIFTDTVGDHVLSGGDVEVAFLKFIPLTATSLFQIAAGGGCWFHHFYYDADGVAASTSTEFLNASAALADWTIEDFAVRVDAAQGDFCTLVSPQRWLVQRGHFWVEGGTWASVFTFSTTPIGNLFDQLWFNGSGASSAYTNLITGVANSDMQLMATRVYVNGTALATATAIETTFGTTGDIDIADCVQTGDATTEGGTLITLA